MLLAREIVTFNNQRPLGTPPACSSLRAVIAGGEVLTTAAASSITAALPQATLCNTYGPTEASVGKPTRPVEAGPRVSVGIKQYKRCVVPIALTSTAQSKEIFVGSLLHII